MKSIGFLARKLDIRVLGVNTVVYTIAKMDVKDKAEY